jgi:hypothetical protein
MPRRSSRIKARGRPKHRVSGKPDEAYRDWIRAQRCCISGKRGVEACHVKSRGAGGTDRGNLVPLTRDLHASQHYMGIQSFQALHGVDLAAIACALDARYERETKGAA